MSYLRLSQVLCAHADSDYKTLVAFDHEQKYTRADFLLSVSYLKQQLQQRTEKRWLLVHDNSYAFAIGLMALLAANKAVVLPSNAQSGTLADLHTHADALLGEGETTLPLLAININTPKPASAPLPTLDSQVLTITVMTSGSTGQAKAITKPLSCFEKEIDGLEALCKTGTWGKSFDHTVVFASVSHQHIYGLLFRVLWPLCAGRAFSATTHQYPEPLIADIKKYPRCLLVSSPAQLKRFPPAIDLSLVTPHIAAVFSSGGPLPLDAAINWEQCLAQAPVEIFGSSETGGVAWRRQSAATPAGVSTPWQVFDGVEIHMDSNQLLSVSSPFVVSESGMAGTSYYATGDQATPAGKGHFYLLGRADTIVKIEEKRLSLPAMEQHLQQNTLVTEARVVPLPDEQGRLGAVIVLTDAGRALFNEQQPATKIRRLLTEKLRAHLLTHYERVLLPRKWRFVENLPANSQGKTTLVDLKALFQTEKAQQTEQRVVSLDLKNNADFFKGHFPGLPILPGVVQLDIALRQCADWYPLHQFSGLEKLKFQEPIVPTDEVTLTVKNMQHGKVYFNYTLFNNTPQQRSLSSGRILFHIKESQVSHV